MLTPSLAVLIPLLHLTSTTCPLPPQCSCTCNEEWGVIDCDSRGLTEVPEWIQSNQVFEVVQLGNNHIKHLTDASFMWIRTRRLELHNNLLTSPAISDKAFSSDHSSNFLHTLVLSNNPLGGVEERYMHHIPSLRRLELAYTNITWNTTELHNLTKLEVLDINGNNLGSLPAHKFQAHHLLLELHAENNGIKNIHVDFTNQVNLLELLDLSQNQLSYLEEDAINRMQFLQRLELDFNHFTRFPREHLTLLKNMEYLSVYGNNINTLKPDDLNDLPSTMKSLYLGNNPLNGQIPGDLFKSSNLVNLLHLNMELLGLDVLLSDFFSSLHNLVQLSLSINSLTSVPNLGGLNKLHKVDLNQNSIASLNPDVFNDTINLTLLFLEDNNIESVNSEFFKVVPGLTNLFLANNQVSVLPACDLIKHSRLKSVYLNYNPLHCGCDLLWMRWFNITIDNSPMSGDIVCASPSHLAGKNVLLLPDDDFDCELDIESTCELQRPNGVCQLNCPLSLVIFCLLWIF